LDREELRRLLELDTYLSLASERDDLDVLEVLEETMLLLDEFAERLKEVDVDEKTPLIVDEPREFREDEPERDPEYREKMLENAPKSEDGYVVAERAHWLR